MAPRSTLVSFARWLATSPQPGAESDLQFITRRLSFAGMADLQGVRAAGGRSFEELYPFLDPGRLEAFEAMAAYLQAYPGTEPRFVDFLLWALEHIPQWNMNRHVDRTRLMREWVAAILKSAHGTDGQACGRVADILSGYCQTLVKESTDLETCSRAISGMLEGLMQGVEHIDPACHLKLVQIASSVIGSGIFDLGEFLKDIPAGSCVDEILQRHYFLLKTLLAFLDSILAKRLVGAAQLDEETKALCVTLRALLLGYYREIVQFLLHTASEEPFLVACSDLVSSISTSCIAISGDGAQETAEFVTAILQAATSAGPMRSFVEILDSACEMLCRCCEAYARARSEAVKSLKAVLSSLALHRAPNHAVASVGRYIGRILRTMLAADNRIFCETFVSNLAVEIPPETPESDPAYPGIINALGSLALGVGDDAITKICLSTLIAQFKRADSKADPEPFYEQLNLVATATQPGYLSSVLDIYVAHFMEAEGLKQLQSTAHALKALTLLNAHSALKSEIILQTVLRLFVDKGLLIVRAHNGKHRAKKSTPLPAPPELECLLPVVQALLAETNREECVNREAKLEAFQEFWFLLVFAGVDWPDSWLAYLPAIALATPVLIKEKDRLKPVTTPLSQVLLSQPVSPQIKGLLTSLLPTCAHLVKTLTLPKCLWLLSAYYSETYKVRHGTIRDLMAYLTSEMVTQFQLEHFVEDIATTIFKRWLPGAAARDQPIIDDYACTLLEYCCHEQERVHMFALRFLKMILDNHRQTYSCHALWEAFLGKINLHYRLCRRDLGEATGTPGYHAINPDYGRAAFEQLVSLARTIFAAASAEYPHDFYAFIRKSLHRQQVFFEGCPGDRDVRMLELLRLCLPAGTDTVASYLGLPLEFQSKPEDYIKWLLSLGNPDATPGDLRAVAWGGAGIAAGSLTRATQHFLAHFDQAHLPSLEAIVEYPFKTGDPSAFKEAVYCWAWLLDERPEALARFLATLLHAWDRHTHSGVGPFGEAPPESVFLRKMRTAPTAIAHIVPQSSPSIPYIILVDFLHERLLLSTRACQESSAVLFAQIVTALLRAVDRVTGLPQMRATVFKVAILAFEFLGQFRACLPAPSVQSVRTHLYSGLLRLFEQPQGYTVVDRDLLRYEEGLILKLRNYFSQERVPNGDAGSPPTEMAEVLRLLLTQELEKLQVWSNRWRGSQSYLQAASLQEYVKVALRFSAPLARQLAEAFTYVPKDAALTGLFAGHSVMADPETVSFFLRHAVPFDTRQLLLAPSLHVVSAINVFRSPRLSAQPMIVNYAMRSMEAIRPADLYFYIPHIVQALRHDAFGYIERTIMHVARTSSLFAHQIIWNMKANTYQDDEALVEDPQKALFDDMIEKVSRLLAGIDRAFFEREFAFFDKVTAISGLLKPYVKKEKWEKKQKIDDELSKIAVDPGVYLPSNPESTVLDIDYQSGRPLQSHAKAPFMATFKVRSSEDADSQPVWQSVIFKVGDDCRQDVLALQLITALKNIFEAAGLNLYYFPYRVVATGPGCGVIEVIPNSISRDQLGREKINSLYDYFVFKFGNERSPKFVQARENFVKSVAAYSLACYLLVIKDRHNGNIMISDEGHIIHIDFGFLLGMSPGGVGIEAPFKLNTEMLQVMGGGLDQSPYYMWFRELTIQGFLACRQHADHLIELVEVMSESGLPCFRGDSTLRKLRQRFRLDLNEADAREFMGDLIYKSCETIRTTLYDRFQERTNGIPY